MNPFHEMANRVTRRTFYMALIWAVLWFAAPWGKSVFAGLTIGSAVSVYFAISVARQIEMATQVAEGVKRKPGVAVLSRLSMVAIAAMVALKLGTVNIYAMVATLFTYQLMIFVDMRIPSRSRKG